MSAPKSEYAVSFHLVEVGPIYLIEGIMDQRAYFKILDRLILPFASWNMQLIWVLQQVWFRVNEAEVLR